MKLPVSTSTLLSIVIAAFVCSACPGPSPYEPPASVRVSSADSPAIASGRSQIVAGWLQRDATSQEIRAFTRHYAFGWGWFFSADIDEARVGQSTLLRLAASGDGSEFAVWYKTTSQDSRIYATRLADDVSAYWEAPQALTDSVAILDLAIAADAHGNAMVIWIQPDYPNNRLYARRYAHGIGWGAAQTIDDNTGHCALPRLAADATGNVIVVWQRGTGVSVDIYANRFSATAGWGSTQLISSGAGSAYNPDIAMNSSGTAMTIWYQEDAGTYNAYARRFTSGSGWEAAQLIESGVADAYLPRVAIDDAGVALAVWHQPDIYFNRYLPGIGWGVEQIIAGGSVGNPRIAVNATGKAILTWNQWDPSSPYAGDALVYARKYDPTSGWATARQVTTELGSANAPHAAIDAQGYATIIWSQSIASGSGDSTTVVFSSSY